VGRFDLPSRFARVDDARDPGEYVDYLDSVSALDGARAYKELGFRLLEVGPGDRLLDVGCGAGEDALELARRAGPEGRVVGVDGSAAMASEARRRALEAGVAGGGDDGGAGSGGSESAPVDFLVGDARALPFDAGAFDGGRVDRVLQHLDGPARAVKELVRVVRPGGRVVACEPDWETLVVTADDRELTRRILNNAADRIPGGWIGRELAPLLRGAGVEEIRVETRALAVSDYRRADAVLRLRTFAAHARKLGLVSGKEARRWLRELRERDGEGRFFSALTIFVVGGRRG